MSIIVKIYLALIEKGLKTLDDIKDEQIKTQVQNQINKESETEK